MNKAYLSLSLGIATGISSFLAVTAEKLKFGVPSWTGTQAIANLLATVVTERIGREAELVPGKNATIFQGMDQGKGDISGDQSNDYA